MNDRILIARLLEFYDPFNALGLNRTNVEAAISSAIPAISSAIPIYQYIHSKIELSDEWHIGRIKFFLENPSSESIEVDNDCRSGWFGPPIVVDGHHRLCAAIIRGDTHIMAAYSGLMSTLNWLKGKLKTCPIN